ncbi:MAG TPA: hypothetical protein VF376_00860 [Thermoanaerobaculia bacterium]
MAAKKAKQAARRVRNLPLPSLTGKQAKRVKGGAITIKRGITTES